MAKASILTPFILYWEGGDKYSEMSADKGGPTKYGITLATWKKVGYDKNGDKKITKEDVKLLTKADFNMVFQRTFWAKLMADDILDQSVANIVVDFAYNSGVSRAAKHLQTIVGVTADGVVGSKTIAAVNNYKGGGKTLFNALKADRIRYLKNVVAGNASQKKFLIGWLNRVNSIRYGSLIYNDNVYTF